MFFFFTCEDDMYFSRVKITNFHVKAHTVFQRCLYNKERLQKGLTGASYTAHTTKRVKKAMG